MTKLDYMFDYSQAGRAQKVALLLRSHGLPATVTVVASVIEDLYLRVFDRRYGVRTNGYIPLANTSLGQGRAQRGHR